MPKLSIGTTRQVLFTQRRQAIVKLVIRAKQAKPFVRGKQSHIPRRFWGLRKGYAINR